MKAERKTTTPILHLSVGGDTSLGVGDLDTESLGLGKDLNALARRDGVSDPELQLASSPLITQ